MDITELKRKITEYTDAHEHEMLDDLMGLIRINSEKSDAEPGKPFGQGSYDALMAGKALCDRYGFAAKVYDNKVVSADMTDYEPQLDILAHMDVVPAGDGWTVCKPFEPVIKDGAVYGRGSSDDKGPMIAALYAMRAVKELGIPMSRNCRLILGSDEETGSTDIESYYRTEKEAPMTFSPDAEFPVINVEKGRLAGTVTWKDNAASLQTLRHQTETAADSQSAAVSEMKMFAVNNFVQQKADDKAEAILHDGVRLLSCTSGDTINIVPNKAEAVIRGISSGKLKDIVEQLKKEPGVPFSYEIAADGTEDAITLNITGLGAHASTPEKAVNALTLMLAVLARLQYADRAYGEAVSKLAALFPYGDHLGIAVGAACEDDIAGKTTLSPSILRMGEHGMTLKFDARTCLKAEEPDTDTISRVKAKADASGFDFSYSFVPAHAVDGNSEFISTLLACYEEVTGRKGSCVAVGGGTYVHELKNGVAFGAVGETTDTHMHGADEFMLVSELKDAAVIYALVIAKLCK